MADGFLDAVPRRFGVLLKLLASDMRHADVVILRPQARLALACDTVHLGARTVNLCRNLSDLLQLRVVLRQSTDGIGESCHKRLRSILRWV